MLLSEPIPDGLDDTYTRLQNWGRWSVERRRRGRAESAEGHYRPRWGNNAPAEDEQPGTRSEIDPADAEFVGRALAPAVGFPMRALLLLKARFVYQTLPRITARHMQMHGTDYQVEFRSALWAAHRRLTEATYGDHTACVTDAPHRAYDETS